MERVCDREASVGTRVRVCRPMWVHALRDGRKRTGLPRRAHCFFALPTLVLLRDAAIIPGRRLLVEVLGPVHSGDSGDSGPRSLQSSSDDEDVDVMWELEVSPPNVNDSESGASRRCIPICCSLTSIATFPAPTPPRSK